jgi:hypothetical protein
MRTATLTYITLAAGLAGACDIRFHDDFEADPAGAPPLTEPVGPPRGDRLEFSPGRSEGDNGESSESGQVVVVAVAQLGGSQLLDLTGPSEHDTSQVIATASPRVDLARPVYAEWTGRLVGSGAEVIFRHPGGDLVVVLQGGTVLVNEAPVGANTANGIHHVTVGYFPAPDGFQLSVSGDATLTQSDFDEYGRGWTPSPTVRLLISQWGPTKFHRYRLDDITIRQ